MRFAQSQVGTAGEKSELAVIRRIRARSGQYSGLDSSGSVRLGIGDDCALLRPRRDEELAVTTDLSIAGRHFRLDWHSPEAVGHRTLARGLSDLAAMGARPMAAFLSLGLPRELVGRGRRRGVPWVERFLDGFFALAEVHKTPLAGGDLAESPIAVADIVLVGAVRSGKALLRSGARAGDLLYVTGRLGGSVAGLAELARLASLAGVHGRQRGGGLRIPKKMESMLRPHLYPQPRIGQGLELVRRGVATAGLDISDGLSTDLAHLCEESGLCAELDAASLPLQDGATLEQGLHGGEDYELLFTAGPEARLPRVIGGVAVTCIGRMVRWSAGRPQMELVTEWGRATLEARGWEHFAGNGLQ